MNIQILAAKENYKTLPKVIASLIEHAFVPLFPIDFFDNVPDYGNVEGIFLYNPTPISSNLHQEVKKALTKDLPVYVWEQELTLDLLAQKLNKENNLINLNRDYGNLYTPINSHQKIKKGVKMVRLKQ